jgi:hypothetical protein
MLLGITENLQRTRRGSWLEHVNTGMEKDALRIRLSENINPNKLQKRKCFNFYIIHSSLQLKTHLFELYIVVTSQHFFDTRIY